MNPPPQPVDRGSALCDKDFAAIHQQLEFPRDRIMDNLHRHLLAVLMDRNWKHGVPAAVDVALLAASTSASPITPWR
jgi:hypothetical protein